MKNFKKIIMIIIVIIIITVLLLLGIKYYDKTDQNQKYNNNEIEKNQMKNDEKIDNNSDMTNIQKVKLVDSRNEYFSIKQCVETFYLYYGYIYQENNTKISLNKNISDDDESSIPDDYESSNKDEYIKAVYNMLDEEYISYKNLTKENLGKTLAQISSMDVDINKMYVSKQNNNISLYIVNGKLFEQQTGNVKDFSLLVKTDSANNTFSIFLDDYIKDKYPNMNITERTDFTLDNKNNISEKEYNKYENVEKNDEEYIKALLLKYRNEILNDPETAYSYLNTEYKNTKFESIENFRNYISNNILRISELQLSKYLINKYDDYTQYVCIDDNGYYYIFNDKGVMNYEMYLDTYTVSLPEFTEKYQKAGTQQKVGMNITKVLDAINEKDYKYVYNKLNSTYRQTKFNNNIEDLENYIKENFVSNDVEYNEFEDVGGTYTYNISFNDTDKTVSFIVKLLDNDDFEIAFGE